MVLSPEMLAPAADAIQTAAALLLQLEIRLDTVMAAAAMAHEHGVPVILNPAPAQPLPAGILRHVTYLVPNEHEAALLTGRAIPDGQSAGQAARRLRELGASQVVLTLGSEGALVLEGDRDVRVPSFPVRAIDATAAGDAFLGAFAVALTEGRTTADAARWGCAAGALACTVLGAQPSLPQRAAVAEMLR
jgi:ribokinase